jgi:hypothetical protein
MKVITSDHDVCIGVCNALAHVHGRSSPSILGVATAAAFVTLPGPLER